MALAIDITDGRSLNNKVHRELLLKKEQGNDAVLAFLYQLYITNKTSIKSGCDV